MHWVSWRNMCKPKSEGGMGFKDLRLFNLALLAKQSWRLLTHISSLVHQILKEKYFPHTSMYEAKMGHSPSYTWRGIFESIYTIKLGARWNIGDGKTSSFGWITSYWIRETSYCIVH